MSNTKITIEDIYDKDPTKLFRVSTSDTVNLFDECLEENEALKAKHHLAIELLKIFVGDESMNMKLVHGHVEKAKILIRGEV